MQLIPLDHVAHIMLGVVSGMSGMSEMCPGCPVSKWTFWTCAHVILSDPVRSCPETCPVMSGKCPVSCPETCPKSVRNVRSCPEKCPGCPITAQMLSKRAQLLSVKKPERRNTRTVRCGGGGGGGDCSGDRMHINERRRANDARDRHLRSKRALAAQLLRHNA